MKTIEFSQLEKLLKWSKTAGQSANITIANDRMYIAPDVYNKAQLNIMGGKLATVEEAIADLDSYNIEYTFIGATLTHFGSNISTHISDEDFEKLFIAMKEKRKVELAKDLEEEWQGVYPGMCINPSICKGRISCPRDISCCE